MMDAPDGIWMAYALPPAPGNGAAAIGGGIEMLPGRARPAVSSSPYASCSSRIAAGAHHSNASPRPAAPGVMRFTSAGINLVSTTRAFACLRAQPRVRAEHLRRRDAARLRASLRGRRCVADAIKESDTGDVVMGGAPRWRDAAHRRSGELHVKVFGVLSLQRGAALIRGWRCRN